MAEGGEPIRPERKSLTGGDATNFQGRSVVEDTIALRNGAGDTIQRRAIAAFSYLPENDDELQLEEGDLIELLGEEEAGWWRGRLKGKIGVFPSNYVEIMDAPVVDEEIVVKNEKEIEAKAKIEDSGDPSTAIQTIPSVCIPPKKPQGVGFGNIFAANDQKIGFRNLKPAGHGNGGDISNNKSELNDGSKEDSSKGGVANEKSGASSSTPAPSNDVHVLTHSSSKSKEYVKVVKAYDAETDDQLSLQIGNTVLVLAKEGETWLGEFNNKRGAFPSNCVTAIGSDEVEKTMASKPPAVPPKLPKKPNKFGPTVVAPISSVVKTSHPSPEPLKRAAAEVKTDPPTPPKLAIISKPTENQMEKTAPRPSSPASNVESKTEKPNFFKNPKQFLPKFLGSREKSPAGKIDEKSAAPAPETKSGDFEGTSTENDSLAHLTAQRPKQNKRPPSQAFLKEMAVIQPAIVATSASPILPQKVQALIPKKPPRSPTPDLKNNGKPSESFHDEYVRREELDKLAAAFETFKRDAADRIKELEDRVKELEKQVRSDGGEKSQKL